MILELRLSNIFSLRDEMTLSLQAAKIQTQKAKALEGNLFAIGGEQMLKSVAVFGAKQWPCNMGRTDLDTTLQTCGKDL